MSDQQTKFQFTQNLQQQANNHIAQNNQVFQNDQHTENRLAFEIDTNLLEENTLIKSPKASSRVNVFLSPKTDNSQKLISQQSPSVLKGKYEVLKKMYKDQLSQKQLIIEVENTVTSKKQIMKSLKTQLSVALTNQTSIRNQVKNKKLIDQNLLIELQKRLKNLQSKNLATVHHQKINQLHQKIRTASQRLINQENQSKNQKLTEKNSEKFNDLRQNVLVFQQKKIQITDFNNKLEAMVISTNSNIENLSSKIKVSSSENHLKRLNELEKEQKQIKNQIEKRKQQIKEFEINLCTEDHQQEQAGTQHCDTSQIKKQIEEIQKQKNQIQKTIEVSHNQLKQISNKIKNNESLIQNKKSRNIKISQKNRKFQEQKNKLQETLNSYKKKPKYEEKIPQQLIQLRKRKSILQKEVQQEIQGTQKQKNKHDNLVPPSIIEKMKHKIQQIQSKNQHYHQLVLQNANLIESNKNLEILKAQLQWEPNPEFKNAEANLIKQKGKLKLVEGEVAELKKINLQLHTKIDQYSKEYPDFKPEKKIKKSELANQPSQNKKQSNDKKKNNLNQLLTREQSEQQSSVLALAHLQLNKSEQAKGVKSKNKSKSQEIIEISRKKQESLKKQEIKQETRTEFKRQTKPAKKQQAITVENSKQIKQTGKKQNSKTSLSSKDKEELFVQNPVLKLESKGALQERSLKQKQSKIRGANNSAATKNKRKK